MIENDGLKCSLFRNCENFNFLYGEVPFSCEDLDALESSVVGIAIPEARGTVGVLIAAVRHTNFTATK
jgi:hypothetical protein